MRPRRPARTGGAWQSDVKTSLNGAGFVTALSASSRVPERALPYVMPPAPPGRSRPSAAPARARRSRRPPARPRSRPSNITMIRSLSAWISSSSTETSRIALPRSRSATICWWMNSIAPISTPRVGCPTSSTSGSRSISRAMTIFCWFPPEKFAVFRSHDGGRTSNFSIAARARSRIAVRSSVSTGPRNRSSCW